MSKKGSKKSFSLTLRNYFITGVVVLIPIGFTLYLSKILIGISSNLIPKNINPNNYLPFNIPGVEIVITVIFITLVGGLSLSFFGKRILKLIDDLFKRIPFLRTVYSAIVQMTETFSKKDDGKKMEDSISEYFYRSNLNDPTANFDWEYILIDNKKVRNAWCMPGGKIAVYTGILDVTKNTNGLAAVMGHEVAHAVAKHSVERASRGVLLNTGTRIIDIASGGILSDINRTTGMDTVGLLSQIGLMNPFNRKQESEADYLGMIFSSLSGYDIRETVKIWERMKEFNKGKEPPQFMSTHPSSDTRIKQLNEWMNEVILDYPPIEIS